jgi:hypothetical protein
LFSPSAAWKPMKKKKNSKKKKKKEKPEQETDSEGSEHRFSSKFGDVFEGYSVPYYPLFEYVIALLLGFIGGAMLLPQSKRTCLTASVFCLVLVVARLLVMLKLRPFLARIDVLFNYGGTLLELFSCVLGVLSATNSDALQADEVEVVAAFFALVVAAAALFPKLNRLFRAIRKTFGRFASLLKKKAKNCEQQ